MVIIAITAKLHACMQAGSQAGGQAGSRVKHISAETGRHKTRTVEYFNSQLHDSTTSIRYSPTVAMCVLFHVLLSTSTVRFAIALI